MEKWQRNEKKGRKKTLRGGSSSNEQMARD